MKARTVSCSVIVVLTMVIGVALPVAAGSPPRAEVRPWVLGHTAAGESAEFFVVLRETTDLAPATVLATKAERGRFVRDSLWQTAQRSQAPLRTWLEENGVWYQPFYIVNVILIRGDRALVDELAQRPDVLRIEGNPVIHNDLPEPAQIAETASPDAIEWGIARTRAPEVWAMGCTGQGIVVGGQDTGVDWDHPAIKNQYRGWNGSSANHDYNWHDSVHGSPGNPCGDDSVEPCDDHGHGTHTIGTVTGDDGGSNQIGMAPGAEWIACRNMDSGNGTPATYLECFEFFLAPYPIGGTPAQGDPAKAPDVTNNSWGCPPSEGCSWDTLQSAVQAQRAAGIMTVVSAGNAGSSCGSVDDPPALYDASYSVAATNSSNGLAGFSSRGPASNNLGDPNLMKPDISAPGVDVCSSVPGGGYSCWQGTSMAGPHIAGAVALLWSAKPEIRNNQTATEGLINDSALRLTSVVEGCGGDYVNGPNNSWGYGLVDVKEALTEDVSLEPTALDIIEVLGNGNTVLETGETFRAAPTWFNPGSYPTPALTGSLTSSSGILPAKSTATYGSIPAGGEASCADLDDCYSARISSMRPAGHHDATITEELSSGESIQWLLHVGESFTDVAADYWAYAFIETIFHHGITAGCGGELFCPEATITRWQMAPFLAKSILDGAQPPAIGTVPGMGGYDCSPGGTSVFLDVPPGDSGCASIHFIAGQQITVGCGGSFYCPASFVDRWQMAVFLTKAMVGDNPVPTTGVVPGLGSYDCSPGGTSVFLDVPPEDTGCPAIHYIAAEGVTSGCGNDNYCPQSLLSRAEMAIFLQRAFSLTLYGP